MTMGGIGGSDTEVSGDTLQWCFECIVVLDIGCCTATHVGCTHWCIVGRDTESLGELDIGGKPIMRQWDLIR